MSANQTKDPRTPRDLETRDIFARPETWSPPETLPTPEPEDGYVFRWVRTATLGVEDHMNVSAKKREGFSPVPAEEQPNISSNSDSRSQYKGCIEIGGLLLCKAPVEFMRQREDYYNQQTRNAQQAVDNNLMKENDPRMPMFKEGKTKITFGSGG